MKKEKIEIDDGQYYSLGEIVRHKFIRGINDVPKASRLVNHPVYRKVLKTKAVKRGARGVQYKVLGSRIKQYLQYEKDGNNTKL